MLCASCGSDNPDTHRFCGHCGAALVSACAACGFANEPGGKFCGGCGAPLSGPQSPAVDTTASTAPAADGERRQVSVLFADLSGFTRLSSGLDPEETHALLNRFFAAADAVVERYGGAVDKHVGDSVMAVFGAPVAHGNDPERAVRAAIDIHQAVAGLTSDGGTSLSVHIGVASGQVVASGTGSAAHRGVHGDGRFGEPCVAPARSWRRLGSNADFRRRARMRFRRTWNAKTCRRRSMSTA